MELLHLYSVIVVLFTTAALILLHSYRQCRLRLVSVDNSYKTVIDKRVSRFGSVSMIGEPTILFSAESEIREFILQKKRKFLEKRSLHKRMRLTPALVTPLAPKIKTMSNRLRALNVITHGNGPITIMLCHGIGTNRTIWSDLMRALLENQIYTVVVFDLACSPLANSAWYDNHRDEYDYVDQYVEDLLAIIDALNVPTVTFVGDGFGGMIGLATSTNRPNRFSKVFLINSSPRFFNENEYVGGYERNQITFLFNLMELEFEDWLDWYSPVCCGLRFFHLDERIKRYFRDMDHRKLVAVAYAYMEHDFRPMLDSVTTPCCIVHTIDTIAASLNVPYYLRDHVQGATSVRHLAIGGNFPHLTVPGDIYSIIREELLNI